MASTLLAFSRKCAAQGIDGLRLAPRAQVIECQRDLASSRVLLEELLKSRVGVLATAEGSEGLTKLLVRQGQARLEPDGLLEARHGLLEALLQRQHATQVLVQVREVRLQRDGETHRLLGLRVPALLAERGAEHAQMLDAARVGLEVRAADLFGPQRPVGPQRLECGTDARVLRLG